jgi:hypothetical protein
MLGAALTSKSLRSKLRPDDFIDDDAQQAVREMQARDAGDTSELVKVPALLRNLGIEVGDKVASEALLETVRMDSRRRRLKAIASSIQMSPLSDEKQISDYIQQISEA